MSPALNKLRAYAELGRISNLPTTLSNVLVGVAIGAAANDGFVVESHLGLIALTWLSIACFYMAGMAMNDLFDAQIDAQERPHRPIPSGRISCRAAAVFMVVLFILGLITLSPINNTALTAGAILVALIVFYNLLHARTAASVLLLGLSRGMIYAVGAAAVTPSMDWSNFELFAGALTIYTAAFSLIARREMHPRARTLRGIAVLLPFIVLLPLPLMFPTVYLFVTPALLCVGYGTHLYWKTPEKTKQAVMLWIAGICLIDAMYLASLSQAPLGFLAVIFCVITLLAQRRIAGT